MALTQCLRRNAQQLGGQTATIDGDRRQTWSEMQDRVARLAAGIRALDVKTGDRIAILAGNSDRYLEFCFATWKEISALFHSATRHHQGKGRKEEVEALLRETFGQLTQA